MATAEDYAAWIVANPDKRGTPEFEAVAKAYTAARGQQTPPLMAAMGNLAGGAVRGAGSIGATLLAPIDMAKDAMAGKGLSLESNRQRRADMDAALNNLGFDTQSGWFQGGKLLSEVGGTMGVGGALARGAQALGAAPSVVSALNTAGFSTGNVPTTLAGRAGDMALRSAAGAVTGGASAGLVSPDSFSSGAITGALLPPGIAAAGAAGRAAGRGLQSGAAVVSDRAAQRIAAREIGNTLGDDVTQAVGDLQTYFPRTTQNVPVSSAAVLQRPEIARLEQASRLRATAPWSEFDARQGTALWDTVRGATREADDLAKAFKDRAENWASRWAEASDKIKPRVFARRMADLKSKLDTAALSPDAVNPSVMAALQEIDDTVMKFGTGFTPSHLQKLRAEFNGKVKPMAAGALAKAPRDSVQLRSLIDEMDDILNAATSGKWDNVRRGYAQDSERVYASKAASKVRGAFVDPDGMLRKTAVTPDVPKVTQAGLRQAIDSARLPDGSTALSGQAQQQLQDVLDAIIRQDYVGGVKRSGIVGGGSDTMSNALSLGRNYLPSWLGGLLDAGRGVVRGRTDAAMASLLMNPDDLALALSGLPRGGLLSPDLAALPYRAAPALMADR